MGFLRLGAWTRGWEPKQGKEGQILSDGIWEHELGRCGAAWVGLEQPWELCILPSGTWTKAGDGNLPYWRGYRDESSGRTGDAFRYRCLVNGIHTVGCLWDRAAPGRISTQSAGRRWLRRVPKRWILDPSLRDCCTGNQAVFSGLIAQLTHPQLRCNETRTNLKQS